MAHSSTALTAAARHYYETASSDDADAFIDALSERIADVNDDGDETALQELLDRLEDIIIDDVVRSADNAADIAFPEAPTPSTSAFPSSCGHDSSESLIQATSLSLIPALISIPSFSPTAAQATVKLCLIVAQRGNPKELWLGLENALDKLAGTVKLSNDPEQLDYDGRAQAVAEELAKVLSVARAVIQRLKVRRPTAFFRHFLATLQQLLPILCDPDTIGPDIEAFPAALLLTNIAEILLLLVRSHRLSASDTGEGQSFQKEIQTLLLTTTALLCPLIPSDRPLCFPSVRLASRESRAQNPGRELLPYWSSLLAAARGAEHGPAVLLAGFRQPNESARAKLTVPGGIILLARLVEGPVEEEGPDSAMDWQELVRILPELLEASSQSHSELLVGKTTDALVYLFERATHYYLHHASSLVMAESSSDRSAFQQTLLNTAEAMIPYLGRSPLQVVQVSITILEKIIFEALEGFPTPQDQLLSAMLEASDPRTASLSIRLLRHSLTQQPQAGSQDSRLSFFIQTFGATLFVYEPARSRDGFFEDALQSLLVSKLNLLYLVLQRDAEARLSDIWDKGNRSRISGAFLTPLRHDLVKYKQEEQEESDRQSDGQVEMAVSVLEDALNRVESALAKQEM